MTTQIALNNFERIMLIMMFSGGIWAIQTGIGFMVYLHAFQRGIISIGGGIFLIAMALIICFIMHKVRQKELTQTPK